YRKTQAAMPPCGGENLVFEEADLPPMAERVERAQAYLAQMDPAISGQGGHNTTYRAARVVCWDFAVSPEEAWPLLQAYNSRCEPPWSPCDLRHKIEDASNNPGENARGWRLMTEETSMVYGLSESYSESPMPRPQLPHLIGQRVQRGSKMFLDSRRLARKYLDLNGAWLWHNGSPYQYKGTMYQEKTAEDLKFRVREFREAEFAARNEKRGKRNTNRNQESIKPVVLRGNVVGDVVDSLKALVAVDSKTPMPCFLDQEDQYAAVDHVPMQNGILDINSRQMQPHTCEWFCAYCLPFAYDPGKDCPTWMAFLQETLEGDAQRIQLLQQWFGYHFWTGQPLQKFLVMLGQGSDGKSVVGTVLRAVLGKENCSAVSPDYFEKDFGLQPMLNKLANISMEPKDGCQFPEEIIKTIVGGDSLTINRKYLDPLSVPLGAKLTFGTNKLPAVRDLSNGFWRRVMILPFNHSVDESKKRSEFMDEKWWLESGELPGIFNWAMEGLTSLKQARRFVEPCLSKEAVDEYRQDSDLTLSYLLENYKVCKEETQTMENIYQNYLDHWKQLKTHLSCLGKRKFTQRVLYTFPGVTVEPVYSAVMKKTVRMVKGLQLISDDLVSEQKTISYPTA
ncbi:MAG: phage/plasmid primase, P4 family, partial [Gemmataceae bacterium]